MTTKHDFSHKMQGRYHSDETIISTDISIRSLLNTSKKEVKVPSHKNSLKETIHCELVMRCMVLMG
jgi:hypothetical protein